ncbi:MAG: hypothetical protein WCR15_01200 [Arcobacteraceae bacterium]
MNITAIGVVFSSYNGKTAQKTTSETPIKEISFDSSVKKTNEKEDVTYHSTQQLSSTSSMTSFKDPTNGKFVVVSLDNSNIEKLKSKFNNDVLLDESTNTYKLTGKAEEFVSNWFADIAYNRNFLQADENNDGMMTEEEYLKTYNDFYFYGEATLSIQKDMLEVNVYEQVTQSYVPFNHLEDNAYRRNDYAKSLDDELNYTLLTDVDYDGKITLKEAYTQTSSVEQAILEDVQRYADVDITSLEGKFFNAVMSHLLDKILEKDEDEKTVSFSTEDWQRILGEIQSTQSSASINAYDEEGKLLITNNQEKKSKEEIYG